MGFIVAFNLYIGYRYARLNQFGVLNSNRKISLKILNSHLATNNGNKDIINLKRLYIVYLILFYLSVISAIVAVLTHVE